jgi:hypothetical protein
LLFWTLRSVPALFIDPDSFHPSLTSNPVPASAAAIAHRPRKDHSGIR